MLTYPLALHRESISSMKMVLGACALARSNKQRTMRSLSPRHLEAKVAEETLKKVVPHSVATALARRVFPVPGGPNIRTPFQGLLIPCNNTKQLPRLKQNQAAFLILIETKIKTIDNFKSELT